MSDPQVAQKSVIRRSSRNESVASDVPDAGYRSGAAGPGPTELEIRVRLTLAATTLNIRATAPRANPQVPSDADADANIDALVGLLSGDVFDAAFRDLMQQNVAALCMGFAGKLALPDPTGTPEIWRGWWNRANESVDSQVAYNVACTLAYLKQDFETLVLPKLQIALSDPELKKRALTDPTLKGVARFAGFKKLVAAPIRATYWELAPFAAYKSALIDGGITEPRHLVDLDTIRAKTDMAAYLKIQSPQMTRLINLGRFVRHLETPSRNHAPTLGVELTGRIIDEGIESKEDLKLRWPIAAEPKSDLYRNKGFGAFVKKMGTDLNVTIDYKEMRAWLNAAD
jgi:hypothetical protein